MSSVIAGDIGVKTVLGGADVYMVIIAVFFLVLSVLNLICVALNRCVGHNTTTLVRGLICGYIAVIYLGYVYHYLVEPDMMRFYMRGAMVVIGLLFAGDTATMFLRAMKGGINAKQIIQK
jgi:hypothetical protein